MQVITTLLPKSCIYDVLNLAIDKKTELFTRFTNYSHPSLVLRVVEGRCSP